MLKKITLVGLFVLASAVSLPLATSSSQTTTASVAKPQQPHGWCPTPWAPWNCR